MATQLFNNYIVLLVKKETVPHKPAFDLFTIYVYEKEEETLRVPRSYPRNAGKNLLFGGAFSMNDYFPGTTLREILRSYQYTLTVVQKVGSFKAFTTVVVSFLCSKEQQLDQDSCNGERST